MKVSVVIPAFNEEKYLGNCLLSLIKQTDPANEIVVVDNNSTDKTAEIAKSFGAKIVKEKRQGLTFARNKGFDSTKHEIIARIDADVVTPPNWLEMIKINFEAEDIDALSGPVVYYDLPLRSPKLSRIYQKSLKIYLRNSNVLLGPNMVITKEIWKKVRTKVNLKDSLVHEDIDLTINILKSGGKIKFDKELIVKTSGRKIIKRPISFFVEYPIRIAKTFWVNRT